MKMWIGTATTNSSGQWSMSFTSAGFTSAPFVRAQAISPNLTTTGATDTTITAPTASGVSGAAFIPNAISLLGVLPLQPAGAGITIQVTAIGN
jgi:hypothetical protein